MAKRNRITSAMSQTIAESSPLIKTAPRVHKSLNNEEILDISLEKLEKNPFQPRIDMNANSLNELISSIEINGLLQPIVVTKKDDSDKYIIIAGHRRYEAHKIMGKAAIKATILQNIHNKELAILSLTENLVRENLHPIENAISIKNILDQNIVESQNKLAEFIGLSKGHISKMMNILKLPAPLLVMIKDSNYRDINILVLLNKLSHENMMIDAFQQIKDLSRTDAEKFINVTYLKKQPNLKDIVVTKFAPSKINVEFNIKNLSPEVIEMIKTKINEISSTLNNNV